MAMDWSNFGGAFMAQPQEDVEDDEDFYGYDEKHVYTNGNDHMQTTAGASTQEQHPAIMAKDADIAKPDSKSPMTPQSEDQKKIEQQNKLEDLRKRLLAKRGNARSNTPSKTPVSFESPQQKMEQQQSDTATKSGANQRPGPVDDFGIDTLLAEGKAAAQAKTARENQAAALAASPAPTAQQSSAISGTSNMEVDPLPQKAADVEQKNTTPNARPLNMSDPYYDDLPVWLEFTGYHDVQFRNSKLSTYKERRELEQEAARIAQKLEKLKQAERADLDSLRATTAHLHTPAAAAMAPPPLPASMPPGDHRPDLFTNGIKRPHSPDIPSSQKASRRTNDSGYRFRGANDHGTNLPRDNGSPVDRRGSFPDRRRSIEDRIERDPSLERRQKHYNQRDGPPPHPSPRGNGYPGEFQRNSNREGPRPFNAREREGRPGFSSVNRVNGSHPQAGSVGLDLRKGGVRYIMIKSWCSDNVTQAMKDGLWATQEKNQQLLTEAFHTSRHVILLFSVNRSMAFQGYALMTSPPDPSLPMPSFCNKLNWATSPAFTVRWLATTPVHFRLVGHLKNTCNPDEEGQPRAVLVGKDGQEISQDAGMGVVWILDEADEVEGRGRLREEKQ